MNNNIFDIKNLSLAYDSKTIIHDLSLAIKAGNITVLLGANGCGKSTLLRGLARLLPPKSGQIMLNGKAIAEQNTKAIAQQLGILPQSPTTFEGITVTELVSLGRYPHQSLFQQWSDTDQQALEKALKQTHLTEFANTAVDAMSGGQRQRAWIAMTLAQETPTLLLDEPTTFLDLAHQIEILNLLRNLNRRHQRSIVMVLHDINLACRYADELVLLKEGRIVNIGNPSEVITSDNMADVFELACDIAPDPITATPMVIPHDSML